MIDSDRPLASLTPESERNLDVLRRAIRRTGGFAFYLVLSADLGRAELLRRLHAWSDTAGVPELRFFAEGAECAAELENLLGTGAGKEPLTGLVIPYGEVLLDTNGGEPLAALNIARDSLAGMVQGPLIVVLPARRQPDFARAAPDLFDVRALSIEVDAMVVELSSPQSNLEFVSSLKGTKRQSREELQQAAARLRVAGANGDVPPGALADAWVKLGKAFLEEGEIGEAREAAETAHGLAESVDYTSGMADSLALTGNVLGRVGSVEQWETVLRRALKLHYQAGDLAGAGIDLFALGDALRRAGRLEEALRIHKEEQLPLFEKLGDVHARALTWGRIAAILYDRGQLDEAMRIMQEEELPVYDKLGDIRARAITWGQIADIFAARSQLEEALRISEKEELPIYERLGDRHSRLVCMINMALVHLRRGAAQDREVAAQLLRTAYQDAEQLRVPEMEQIARIRKDAGLPE